MINEVKDKSKEKVIESVSKIEMGVFCDSDPVQVLRLQQTPDKALDENRKKVEEYIALGCSDEQIAEALRLTTKKDFWSACHIKKARGRWKRADKKAEGEVVSATDKKGEQDKGDNQNHFDW